MPRKEDYEGNRPYLNLPDYKGPFRPGLRYEDFSKERLAAFYNTAGRMFLSADGCWSRHVEDKYGWDAAMEGFIDVWQNRITYAQHVYMFDMLGITGENDLVAIMKHNQFDIGWTYPLFEITAEMPDDKHGYVYCWKCRPEEHWYNKGQPEKLFDICNRMEPMCFENYTAHVNPQVTCRPIKIPPKKNRSDRNEATCIWEYTYVRNAMKEWPKKDWHERWKNWTEKDLK